MSEPVYFEGYNEALRWLSEASVSAMLGLIDSLYGRNKLSQGFSVDELRFEATRQMKLDWLNQNNESYHMRKANLETMEYSGQKRTYHENQN
jgi:hypothetical protein